MQVKLQFKEHLHFHGHHFFRIDFHTSCTNNHEKTCLWRFRLSPACIGKAKQFSQKKKKKKQEKIIHQKPSNFVPIYVTQKCQKLSSILFYCSMSSLRRTYGKALILIAYHCLMALVDIFCFWSREICHGSAPTVNISRSPGDLKSKLHGLCDN